MSDLRHDGAVGRCADPERLTAATRRHIRLDPDLPRRSARPAARPPGRVEQAPVPDDDRHPLHSEVGLHDLSEQASKQMQ